MIKFLIRWVVVPIWIVFDNIFSTIEINFYIFDYRKRGFTDTQIKYKLHQYEVSENWEGDTIIFWENPWKTTKELGY